MPFPFSQERAAAQADLLAKVRNASDSDVVFAHPVAIPPLSLNLTLVSASTDYRGYAVPGAEQQCSARPTAQQEQLTGPTIQGVQPVMTLKAHSFPGRAASGGLVLLPPVDDADSEERALPPPCSPLPRTSLRV